MRVTPGDPDDWDDEWDDEDSNRYQDRVEAVPVIPGTAGDATTEGK
jgi:hypothetical protein